MRQERSNLGMVYNRSQSVKHLSGVNPNANVNANADVDTVMIKSWKDATVCV